MKNNFTGDCVYDSLGIFTILICAINCATRERLERGLHQSPKVLLEDNDDDDDDDHDEVDNAG